MWKVGDCRRESGGGVGHFHLVSGVMLSLLLVIVVAVALLCCLSEGFRGIYAVESGSSRFALWFAIAHSYQYIYFVYFSR